MALTQQQADLLNFHPMPNAFSEARIGSVLQDLQNGRVSPYGFVAGSITGYALRSSTVSGTTSATAGQTVTVTSSTGGKVQSAPNAILFSVQGNAYVVNGGVAVSGGEVTFTVASAAASQPFTIVFLY